MNETFSSSEEVARLGESIYAERIRPIVEPSQIGRYIVIDVATGDYEIDDDDIAVMERAAEKHPAESLYGKRIGYRGMGQIGPRLVSARS